MLESGAEASQREGRPRTQSRSGPFDRVTLGTLADVSILVWVGREVGWGGSLSAKKLFWNFFFVFINT